MNSLFFLAWYGEKSLDIYKDFDSFHNLWWLNFGNFQEDLFQFEGNYNWIYLDSFLQNQPEWHYGQLSFLALPFTLLFLFRIGPYSSTTLANPNVWHFCFCFCFFFFLFFLWIINIFHTFTLNANKHDLVFFGIFTFFSSHICVSYTNIQVNKL